jgi:hypothetical protein
LQILHSYNETKFITNSGSGSQISNKAIIIKDQLPADMTFNISLANHYYKAKWRDLSHDMLPHNVMKILRVNSHTYFKPVRSLPKILITPMLNTKLENTVNKPATPE